MASTYLTHTHGSAGTLLTKGTFSAWVKRSAPSGEQTIFTGNKADNSQRDFIRFEANSQLRARGCGGDWNLETTQVFRDVNAWYHIVLSIDTTQGTDTNRLKLYVNGVQVTSFSSPTYPSQNYTLEGWSNQSLQTIGRDGKDNNTPFDGILSHVHWIDGTAYPASTFGSEDATTGEWIINTSPTITMGNNGFTILKDGMTITDQSSNSNNFSLGGGTLTKTEDNPSNVFATLNALDFGAGSSAVYSYGNNRVLFSGSAIRNARSTLGMTSGKYYFEIKLTGQEGSINRWRVGITNRGSRDSTNFNLGTGTYEYGWNVDNGDIIHNNSTSVSGYGTCTTNDICSVALDLDNNKLYFAKNGTWQNSANPSSGTNGISITDVNSVNDDGAYFFAVGKNDGTYNYTLDCNFGNGYFGTTAVSSAGTNASGIGIFEYNVPNGFTALSTKGLNE